MNRYQKLKGFVLLLVVAVSAKAQIENGKVYNIVNVGNSTKSMVIASNNGVNITGTNTTDYNQLWYVSQNGDNSYSLRNLGNGRYLRSSNTTSARWTTVREIDANCKFSCIEAGAGFTLRATNTTSISSLSHYMHYSESQGTVVCWSADAAATQWTMNEVGVDSNVLEENWKELVGVDPSSEVIVGYQIALKNLFSDDACTVLKKSFVNESAVRSDADYNALPTALQNMVMKVFKDSWAENNYSSGTWDEAYAKKYRVQLYEPYNEPEAAATALGINAHTNLNNPTGIFANGREVIYVMVGGDIEEGASLYLASYAGNDKPGGYAEGVELKRGLNVIPSFTEGNNYVINYVVHTFDTSDGKKGNAAKARKLSDYEALKIHIEGGYINGYWNKVGDELYGEGDDANDWQYLKARATQTTVTVLGEYITLQFPLRNEDAVDNNGNPNEGLAYYLDQADVNKVINEWDNVMMWERFLLGVLGKGTTTDETKNVKSPYSDSGHVIEYTGEDGDAFATDYSDYYNVHGLSLGVGYNYMYGGWDHCGYHYNTMQSIIVDILTNAGSHWGPGHEIGHQHQGLLNLNGLTEVTNNLFANVVLWYFGETTSRVNGNEGSLSNVLAAFNTEGSDFYTNNIWGQTQMYYKLFLYYHVLGHNPKFYPRLFEMLRQDPMVNGANIDGATSLLHFYKKCCLASGDDLTEFFRAYGFFHVMTNRLVSDYSNGIYNMSQKDIDEAIAEVKALGYDENLSALFINDATGETIKSHKGDNLDLYGETTVCAEVGSYASFADSTTPDYSYSIIGNVITMSGTGGAGFAVFDESDELIAFSDKKKFQVTDACVSAISTGKASVKVVKGDNSIVPALDVADTDNVEAKYMALGELLTSVADLLAYLDTDNTKPGFYKASALETLQVLYESSLSVYENKEESSYMSAYDALSREYSNVLVSTTGKTPILAGSTYVLTSKRKYEGYAIDWSMTVNNGSLVGRPKNLASAAQQWVFVPAGTKDTYYLKSVESGKYLGRLSQSTQVSATASTTDEASPYKAYDLGMGLWALQCQDGNSQSLHLDGSAYVVGWSHTSAEDEGSWWYLTATDIDTSMLPLYDLQELIVKTEGLVDEMAVVQKVGAIDMSTCTITSNATESGHETMYLTDGNPSTFFHTNWQGTVISEYHNLVIDLGEHHNLSEFVLNYMTLPENSSNVDAPTSILVAGSHDGNSYSSIATLDGLPTTKGAEYTSDVLGNASDAYRYIRLQVTKATGGTLGWKYYYFGLAELGLIRMSTLVETIDEKYDNFITVDEIKDVCNHLYVAQQKCSTGSVTTEDVEAMKEQYDRLFAAYDNANNREFNAKKNELIALIDNTNSLINSCGTVTYTPGNYHEQLALQTTDFNGDNYLSTNAAEIEEGDISYLLIDDNTSYFHSAWSWDVNAVHHLKVDLGNGKSLKEFTFTYRTHKYPYPYEIKVYGSNNDAAYTLLKSFSKDDAENGLPTSVNNDFKELWTSSTISSNVAYRYLRFDVTVSGGFWGTGNNPKGEYCFTMSYFGITTISETESYTVELGDDMGDVTEELLLETYKATQEVQAVVNSAFTKEQLQEAYDRLRAQRKALYEARYMCVEYIVSIIGTDGDGGVIYDGVTYTETLTATEALIADELIAMALDGYNPGIVTVDNEMGVITVSYTVDKSAWDGLVEEVEILLASCSAYVNSLYVTESLVGEIETAISDAKEQCDKAITLIDYEAAKTALQIAKDMLSSAIASAEEEAGEREDLLLSLGRLIVEVETLISDCGVISPEGIVESMNPNGSVTEEQLLTVYNVLNTAKGMDNTFANTTIADATAELENLYSALGVALNTLQLPIILTTDMERPVLYIIGSKRGDTKVLQYDPKDNHMFSIADAVEGCAKQVFYFTVGDTRTQVYLHPFVAGEQVLAASDVANGAAKVFAAEKGALEYEQWMFVKQADGYNLKPVGVSVPTYFSNFGAGENKMGFYSYSPDTDDGSRFTFTETTMEESGAYHSLKTYYDEVAMVGLVGGTAPGYYPEVQVSSFNEIYTTVATYLNGDATYAQCLVAYQALRVANESLTVNMPEEGKFYVLRSVTKDALAYAKPSDGKIYWSKDVTPADDIAVWTFVESGTEGIYHIQNVHTGTYMSTFADQVPSSLSKTAGNMEIVSLSGDGQVGIKCNGTMMHVQYNGAVVHWNTGANEGSAWRIEEVNDATNVETAIVEMDAAIYDLCGRRVLKVVVSGLYIVDGKKCYIQVK